MRHVFIVGWMMFTLCMLSGCIQSGDRSNTMVELQPAATMNSLNALRTEVQAKALDRPFQAIEPTVDDFTFQIPEAWRELVTVEQYAAVHNEDSDKVDNSVEKTMNSLKDNGNRASHESKGRAKETMDKSMESGYSASMKNNDKSRNGNNTAITRQTPYAKYEVNFLYTPKQSGLFKASMLKIMVFDKGEWKRAEQEGSIPQVNLLTQTSKLVYAVNLPIANPYPAGDDHLMYDSLLLSFQEVKQAFVLPG